MQSFKRTDNNDDFYLDALGRITIKHHSILTAVFGAASPSQQLAETDDGGCNIDCGGLNISCDNTLCGRRR